VRRPALALAIAEGMLVLALLFLWRWDPMPLPPDEAGTRTELLRHVPIGTPVQAARRTMERGGFTCELEDRSERLEDRLEPEDHRLYCGKTEWYWFTSREWRALLSIGVDDQVQDVQATYGVTAP